MEAVKSNRPWVKWYKTAAWKRLRAKQLSRSPMCKFCLKNNLITEANTVDHVEPHRGNMEKFFNLHNLQSLCKSCHSSAKQRIEKSGEFGCDVDGNVVGWK